MKILSDLDWQIINYFYSQFKHIGSLFYLSPTYGVILYISTVAYIITFPFSNNNKTNTNKSKRTRL
jgi:hypothetical protein